MTTILALFALLQANWPSILAALAALHVFLGVINKLFVKVGSEPAWWKTLLDLTGALPQSGAVGALGQYSPPMMGSRMPKPRLLPPPPPAIAAVLALALLSNACGFCAQAANKGTARCEAQAVTLNCGAPEVAKAVLSIAADVAAALLSSDYSALLDQISAGLEKQGISDAWGLITCAVNQVEGTPTMSISDDVVVLRAEDWKKAHPARVK